MIKNYNNLFRKGSISVNELVDQCFNHIRNTKDLNAFITVCEENQVKSQANQSQQRFSDGI